jgi:hypothetical protein
MTPIGIGTRVQATIKGERHYGTVVSEYLLGEQGGMYAGRHTVYVKTDVRRFSPITGRAYDGTLVPAGDITIL